MVSTVRDLNKDIIQKEGGRRIEDFSCASTVIIKSGNNTEGEGGADR